MEKTKCLSKIAKTAMIVGSLGLFSLGIWSIYDTLKIKRVLEKEAITTDRNLYDLVLKKGRTDVYELIDPLFIHYTNQR